MRGFRIAWNLLCGIPLLIPDFLYASHTDHQVPRAYGTAEDGEYWPWGRPGNPLMMVVFVLSSCAVRPAAVARFGLFRPLSWASAAIGGRVIRHASVLAVHFRYRCAASSFREKCDLCRQEAGAFVYLVASPRPLWRAAGRH
jgi:hypothetical protein